MGRYGVLQQAEQVTLHQNYRLMINLAASIATIVGALIFLLEFLGVGQQIRTRLGSMPSRNALYAASAIFFIGGLTSLIYSVFHLQKELSRTSSQLAETKTKLAQTQASLSRATAPKFPSTVVWFTGLEPRLMGRGQSAFVPNQPATFNIYISDIGPTLAQNVSWTARVVDIAQPVPITTEDAMYANFLSASKDNGGYDLTVGDHAFGTFKTNVLSRQDAADLLDGRNVVYAFGHATYDDANGRHELRYCRWLQAPGNEGIVHYCAHNNTIVNLGATSLSPSPSPTS